MKHTLTIVLFCILPFLGLQAQSEEDPGAYMNVMGQKVDAINESMFKYMSAMAHSSNPRKEEGTRQALLATIETSRKEVAAMKPFKTDASLRDSIVAFLKISYYVINFDYGKLMNLEEVEEQTYDQMEAFYLAQDIASERISASSDRLSVTQKAFAERHGVTIVEGPETELNKKLMKAGEVNRYHREVYMIFFKVNKQEQYLTTAIAQKDLNAIEQNRSALEMAAKEGLTKLASIKAYSGDASLMEACKQALLFYQTEANSKVKSITSFYLKEDEFNKMKAAFDAKKQSDKTQADVDKYNSGVNDLNAAAKASNTVVTELNTNRASVVNGWNNASTKFLDKHVPK
jgi:hypothetical protein